MKLYEVAVGDVLSDTPRDLQVSDNFLYYKIGNTVYAASLVDMEVIASWSSDYLKAFYVHSDSRIVVSTTTLNLSSDWGRLKCYVLSFNGTSFSVIANSPDTADYNVTYRTDNYCWCNNDYAYIKHDCTVKCIRISSNTDFNAWNPGFPELTCFVTGNNNYLFVQTRRLYTTGFAAVYAFSIGSGGALSLIDSMGGEEKDTYVDGVYTDSNNVTYTQTRHLHFDGSVIAGGTLNKTYISLVGTENLLVYSSYTSVYPDIYDVTSVSVSTRSGGTLSYVAFLSVDYAATGKIISKDLKWLYVSDFTNKKIRKYGFIDTKDTLTIDITHT